jgi:hypothetical protein
MMRGFGFSTFLGCLITSHSSLDSEPILRGARPLEVSNPTGREGDRSLKDETHRKPQLFIIGSAADHCTEEARRLGVT